MFPLQTAGNWLSLLGQMTSEPARTTGSENGEKDSMMQLSYIYSHLPLFLSVT